MPRVIPAPGVPNGLIYSPAASSVPLTVVGFSGQSEDLQRWTNSAGTVLSRITKDGWIAVGASTAYTALSFQPANGSTSYAAFLGNANGANPPTAISNGLVIGWNRSGGAGESVLGFCTDVGSDPRLDIAAWKGSTSVYVVSAMIGTGGKFRFGPAIYGPQDARFTFAGTGANAAFAFEWGADSYFPEIQFNHASGNYKIAGYLGLTNGGNPTYGFGLTNATTGSIGMDQTSPLALAVNPAVIAFRVLVAASQTANLQEWRDNSNAVLSTVSENGYYTTRKVAAPADGELAASEVALWFDATNGAAKLKIKGKSADGTVVTGEVALA